MVLPFFWGMLSCKILDSFRHSDLRFPLRHFQRLFEYEDIVPVFCTTSGD